MGGAEQLARFAGLVVGLVLALAAAAPFTGVPPLGVSGTSGEPGTVALDVAPNGELSLDPSGQVLAPTAIRTTADPAGPGAKLTIQNISPRPIKLSLRLVPVGAALGDAVLVRASVARTVVFDGSLRDAEAWSAPTVGTIAPGATTTLRLRLKLKEGLPPEAWIGRADQRRIELQTIPEGTTPAATTPDAAAATSPTSPQTPPASTPPQGEPR